MVNILGDRGFQKRANFFSFCIQAQFAQNGAACGEKGFHKVRPRSKLQKYVDIQIRSDHDSPKGVGGLLSKYTYV